MPLLAPAAAPTAPEPQPEPALLDKPFATWTPAGGPQRILSGADNVETPGVFLLRGMMGLDQPPEEQFRTPLTAGDGSIFQNRRAAAREVMLPVAVKGSTFSEHETQRRALLASFDPRRGPGVLAWALPDGTRRELACRYVRGGEAAVDGHRGIISHSVYQLVLVADDPYFYGEPATHTVRAPVGVALLPGPPFTISESTAFGTSTHFIDGEVETFPDWLITGPASTTVLANETTGKTLQLTPNLLAGQTLRIRTDPRTMAAAKFTDANGVNRWAQVAGQFPQLWPLLPGANVVTITLSGTSAASEVQMTFRPRYLTA
jgi:hypothetical protein